MAKSFYLYIDCTNPDARKFTKNLIKNCTTFSVPEHLNKSYNYFIATIDNENRLTFRVKLRHPKYCSFIDIYEPEECNIHNFADRLVKLCFDHSNAFKTLNEQRNFRSLKDSSIIHLIDYINKNYIQPSQITINNFFNSNYISKLYKENFIENNNMRNFYITCKLTTNEDKEWAKEIIRRCQKFNTTSNIDWKRKNYISAYLNTYGNLKIGVWEHSHHDENRAAKVFELIVSSQNWVDTILQAVIYHLPNVKDSNIIQITNDSIIILYKYIQGNDLPAPSQNTYKSFINNPYINNLLKTIIPNYETQLQRETNSQSVGGCTNQSRIYCRRAKTQLCCYDVKPQEINRNKKERNYRGLY